MNYGASLTRDPLESSILFRLKHKVKESHRDTTSSVTCIQETTMSSTLTCFKEHNAFEASILCGIHEDTFKFGNNFLKSPNLRHDVHNFLWRWCFVTQTWKQKLAVELCYCYFFFLEDGQWMNVFWITACGLVQFMNILFLQKSFEAGLVNPDH